MILNCDCVLYYTVEPPKADTIGTEGFILYSEVSLAQGLVAGHVPVLIVFNYDGARP